MLSLDGFNQQRPRGAAGGRNMPDASRRPGPRPGAQRRPQPPRRQGRWFRAILMVFATVGLCFFLALFAIQSASDLFGLEQIDKDYEVEIPENANMRDIASILKSKGVIDQSLTFRLYAGLKMKDTPVQAGTYMLNSKMSFDEIFVELRRGSAPEEVRLIFREGRTVYEIAAILEEYEVCGAQEFLDYLQDGDFEYEFMNQVEDDPLRFRRMEGYIFPATYDFYVGENVKSVANKFLEAFNEKMMTDEMRSLMRERNLSLDETIILASIIQREAGAMEDMRMVSSVFRNRLDNSGVYPSLQSDVTIFYVENNIKPFLEEQNQEMYDAYNTYVCEGLPVGPICNPGMDAIEAALNPAESDFFFFVTDSEERFYYAETADEHYKNVREAESVGGEAHGIDTQ